MHQSNERLSNERLSNERLSNQVIALLRDPAKRKALGKRARQYAVANYDLQTVSLPKLSDIVQRYR